MKHYENMTKKELISELVALGKIENEFAIKPICDTCMRFNGDDMDETIGKCYLTTPSKTVLAVHSCRRHIWGFGLEHLNQSPAKSALPPCRVELYGTMPVDVVTGIMSAITRHYPDAHIKTDMPTPPGALMVLVLEK